MGNHRMSRFMAVGVSVALSLVACRSAPSSSGPRAMPPRPTSAAPTSPIPSQAPPAAPTVARKDGGGDAKVAPLATPKVAQPPRSYPVMPWEHALPPGFVALWNPTEGTDAATEPVECMGLRVRNAFDASAGAGHVEVTNDKGQVVYRARGRLFSPYGEKGPPKHRMSLWATACGDLNGDRTPDLLLTERTLGAHCCYTHYAISLSRPAKTLWTWEKGEAGTGVVPMKLKSGRHFQLVSGVVMEPPTGVMSYANTPIFPIVFDLVGGTYRARTFRFRDFIAAERERFITECKTMNCSMSANETWGTALIVGDWPQQRKTLSSDDSLDLFDKHTDAFRAQLERELGR